jgi:hypothetical protein
MSNFLYITYLGQNKVTTMTFSIPEFSLFWLDSRTMARTAQPKKKNTAHKAAAAKVPVTYASKMPFNLLTDPG